jgi:hypothetical protein
VRLEPPGAQVGTLTFVSGDFDTRGNGAEEPDAQDDDGLLSGFGIASTVLGLICVAAIVLTFLIWFSHRDERDELAYKAEIVQTAVNWAGVLINLNKDNIDSSVQKLHEGTVGELNTELDKVIAPLVSVVKTAQSKTTGQINAVAIESVYHDLDRQPGGPPPTDPTLGGLASRTDTVLIIATLVSENAGGKRPPISLNLRIAVSDVNDQLLVSRLVFLR